jgi:hypothetical protein
VAEVLHNTCTRALTLGRHSNDQQPKRYQVSTSADFVDYFLPVRRPTPFMLTFSPTRYDFFPIDQINLIIRQSLFTMSAGASSDVAAKRAEEIRKKFPRFRALVLGRANAGKTTLLEKVCKTTEQPEIFDAKGNKASIHQLRKLTDSKIIVLD